MRKNKLELRWFDQVLRGFGAYKKSVNPEKFWHVGRPAGLGKWWKPGLKVLTGRIFTGLKLKVLWGEKGLKNSS